MPLRRLIPATPVVPAVVVARTAKPIGASNDYCVVVNESKRAYSVFGLVAWGDASIERARVFEPSGYRLSRIATIDMQCRYFLGVGYCKTVVCGFFR